VDADLASEGNIIETHVMWIICQVIPQRAWSDDTNRSVAPGATDGGAMNGFCRKEDNLVPEQLAGP